MSIHSVRSIKREFPDINVQGYNHGNKSVDRITSIRANGNPTRKLQSSLMEDESNCDNLQNPGAPDANV